MSNGMKPRGRPRNTPEDHMHEAARVLNVATVLRRLHGASAAALDAAVRPHGFASGAAALRFVQKRRRGPVAELIGDDVEALMGGKPNATQAALRLITEHGASVGVAARCVGADISNVRRALKAEELAVCDEVANAAVKDDVLVTDISLPENTL